MKTVSQILLAVLVSLWAIAAWAININTATAEQLAESLEGVGPAKAEAIVAYREQHGAFKTLKDLGQVKGIGETTLEKNKDKVEF